MGQTLSNETREPGAEQRPRATAHLYRVLCAVASAETPARHVLAGVDEVRFGRGDRTGHHRDSARLDLQLADAHASEVHARLGRSMGRWQIEDLGAKNGTLINGARIGAPTLLADGDLIEVGRTFFLFAAGIDWQPGQPVDAGPVEPLPGMPTVVPALADVLAALARVAASSISILLRGATGTGKEVASRGIHAASGRAGAFVPINCGAIPRELVESALFGHRRGAFSGAVNDQPGLVAGADRGTLFLDEIGDLPLPAQAALLRVLQEHEVMAIGASRAVPVDLRVVCATHRDLPAMVAAGDFRQDLLYRLQGLEAALPDLADRRADLGLLITRLAGGAGPVPVLHPRAARALLVHDWPGNVRELEQALGTAIALAAGTAIQVAHLPAALNGGSAAPAPADAQRERLVALLGEHRGNIRAVARALGKDPVQIRRWLRRYGLDAAAFQRG